MSWELALTGLLVLATLGLVGVTYFLVRVTNKQVGVSQSTLAASQRPFLAPTSRLTLTANDYGRHFEFDQLDPGEAITLTNAGPGLALNIVGILVQPRPQAEAEMRIVPRLRYVMFDTPLVSGSEVVLPTMGGGYTIGWDMSVSDSPDDTLVAPRLPTIGEQIRDTVYRVVARLTVTYDDISGITYASQYDYTDQNTWRFHMSHQVPKGIEALARERNQNQETATASSSGQSIFPDQSA